MNDEKQKIVETVKEILCCPRPLLEFKKLFHEKTGWHYVYDSFPATLKSETRGDWLYETLLVTDTVKLGSGRVAKVRAVQEWAINGDDGEIYLNSFNIEDIVIENR